MHPRLRWWMGTLAAAWTLVAAGLAAGKPVPVEDGTITYQIQHRVKTFEAVAPASVAALQLDWGDGTLAGLRFTATVPLGAFDSGNRLRDEHAAEALELFLFPEATWVVEQVEVQREVPGTGPWTEATVVASGPLTLRGETRVISVEVGLKRDGDRVSLSASFPLSLTEFGIERPGLLGVKIDDTVNVTVALEAPAG